MSGKLRVVAVVNWRSQRVHGITSDQEEAKQWVREICDKYGDPLAAGQCVDVVDLPAGVPVPSPEPPQDSREPEINTSAISGYEPRRGAWCNATYEREGGRQPGDRLVVCALPAGHPGEHEEADTEVTWLDPPDPLPPTSSRAYRLVPAEVREDPDVD